MLTGHCESNHLIQNKCTRFALRESGPRDGFQTYSLDPDLKDPLIIDQRTNIERYDCS